MNEREIDGIIKAAAETRGDVDPRLVERIAQSVAGSARPVPPLPRRGVTAATIGLACTAVAVGAAVALGVHGLPKLSPVQIAAIFAAVAALGSIAAVVLTSQMTPGSRNPVAPAALAAGGTLALAALFAALFSDHHTVRFVQAGLVCLKAGVAVGVPAALASWFCVRRGFFVTPVAAGLAAGALGGLAGIAMLEIHCPNLQMFHILVWHTAVLPVSSGLGAIVARVVRRFRTRRAG